MERWIGDHLHLRIDEAGLLIAVVTLLAGTLAFVKPSRAAVARAWRWLLLQSGQTKRRYARSFLREHGVLRNIFDDTEEQLDLAGTYVSLSFYSRTAERESRVLATTELAKQELRRVIVVGDPGTGKSTLLRAYGAGVMRSHIPFALTDLEVVVRSNEVPIFVPLRQFARRAASGVGLADFIINDILGKQLGVGSPEMFMQRALRQDACLVLLDGLDEVVEARYEAVRRAIYEFALGDETKRARMIISCRGQNFLQIAMDWVPAFAEQPYTLAPLRDAEIWRFLEKRRRDYAGVRSPEVFYRSVMASTALDLHRIPLILTISLGLYLRRSAYEIPSSIATFYEALVREQLRRHDFPEDPRSEKVNQFGLDDKLRFLRSFAREAAKRAAPFDEFTFMELAGYARFFTQQLARVRPTDCDDFIREIINHSGLLMAGSDEDGYLFSHRSIHEYLVAAQLQREADGQAFLWEHAMDREWRQVILFFAALDHDHAEAFLHGMGQCNLELAVRCLSVAAPVQDQIANQLLGDLAATIGSGANVSVHLAALIAAVRSRKYTVQERALQLVRESLETLLKRDDLPVILGAETESVIRLLDTIAETGSAEVARTVPTLARLVADDESRVVPPLWKCLAVDGLDREAAEVIVLKLIELAISQACLQELQAQPAYQATFATESMRRFAYPFEHGLDRNSNFVTLLTWLDHLSLAPPAHNRFLLARATARDLLSRLEHDRRSRSIRVDLHMVGIILGCVGLATVPSLIVELVTGWGSFELGSLGWWSLAIYLGCALLAMGVDTIIERRADIFSQASRRTMGSPLGGLAGMGEFGPATSTALFYLVWFSTPIALGPPFRLLPIPLFVPLVTAVTWLVFQLPMAKLCGQGSYVYLRRPNPFIDMYDDSLSRHWLIPTPEGS